MESRDEAGGARFVKRLRVRLQDYKFSVVYRAMKKVGWSWNGVSYAPPPLDENKGYVARNAKETTLYLDQFAVQPIDNLLQLRPSSNSPAIAHDKVEQQQGRRLRNQLVDAVLQMKTESSSDVESTTNSSGNEADSTDSSPERPQLRKRRPERRQNTSASATAVERGSSLHMRKPTKRAKKNQPRNNKTKENDSETTEELDLPSPSDVAAHFQDDNDTRFTKVEKKHQKHFQGWLSLLSMKHSLLFYGVGSKQSLLNDFAESTLEPSGDVLVIDGFDRNVEIDAILDLIEFHHLETSTRRRRDGMDGFRRQDTRSYSTMDAHPVVQRAARLGEAVAKHQLERARPLFLVIHNMDGHGLRNRTIQRALATFVEHSAIAEEVNAVRLAASVDHVNAATLLWDVHTSAAFSWIWKEVNTHRPGLSEMDRGGLDLAKRKAARSAPSATMTRDETFFDVLTTLAPRHAEVLQIITGLQLENPHEPVPYKLVLRESRDKCVTPSDSNLRILMGELLDHFLIEMERDRQTGNEYVRVPYSRDRMNHILNFRR